MPTYTRIMYKKTIVGIKNVALAAVAVPAVLAVLAELTVLAALAIPAELAVLAVERKLFLNKTLNSNCLKAKICH